MLVCAALQLWPLMAAIFDNKIHRACDGNLFNTNTYGLHEMMDEKKEEMNGN